MSISSWFVHCQLRSFPSDGKRISYRLYKPEAPINSSKEVRACVNDPTSSDDSRLSNYSVQFFRPPRTSTKNLVSTPTNIIEFLFYDIRAAKEIFTIIFTVGLPDKETLFQNTEDVFPNSNSVNPADPFNYITLKYKQYTIEFRIVINPEIKDNYFIGPVALSISTQSEAPNNINLIMNSMNNFNKKYNKSPDVEVIVQTDLLGLNLGDVACIVNSDRKYPNGYPKKFIGYCDGNNNCFDSEIIQTFYSDTPNLQKVLKENGNTLFSQIKKINHKYNENVSICDFYESLLFYSSIRYMLAGLSNNSKFSLKWLYANHYQKFLINLKNSEFRKYTILFIKPFPKLGFDFTEYNKYFRNCHDHSL